MSEKRREGLLNMAGEIGENCVAVPLDSDVIRVLKNKDDDSFDEIIGHIEDILLEDEFQSIQQRFLEKYWVEFEPVEENKLVYTDIFNEYNKAIETYIVSHLRKVMPHFDINSLLRHLEEKQSELEGEVFEVLSTFTDFMAFKEMFLDYRAVKEGKVQDLSCGISVTSIKLANSD